MRVLTAELLLVMPKDEDVEPITLMGVLVLKALEADLYLTGDSRNIDK